MADGMAEDVPPEPKEDEQVSRPAQPNTAGAARESEVVHLAA